MYVRWKFINIDSGYGLMPDGTKQLPKPVLSLSATWQVLFINLSQGQCPEATEIILHANRPVQH